MKVKKVVMILCEACLNGEGQECHTPECALCRHDVPGPFPIMPELYEVLEEWDTDAPPQATRDDTMSLFAETIGDPSVGIPGDLCEFRFSKCLVEDDEDLREWMRKEFAEFAVGVMDSGPNIWFSDECPVCRKRFTDGSCGNQDCPVFPREDPTEQDHAEEGKR